MEEMISPSTIDRSDSATKAVLRAAAERARAKGQPITIFHDGRRLRILPDGRTEDIGPAPSETSGQLAARLEMGKPGPAKFELRDIGIRPAPRKSRRTAPGHPVRTDKQPARRPQPGGTPIKDDEQVAAGKFEDGHVSQPASEPPAQTAKKAPSNDELATAASSTTEYNLKVAAAACANAKNMLQFTGELMRAKTFADMLEVSAAYTRRQMEAGAEQARDLAAAAQKIAPKTPEGGRGD
jgi:hypothetical protein